MFLIYLTYSNIVVGITVHAIDLMVDNIKMGKKITGFICQFKLEYYPGDIEKKFDPREIGNIFESMKNDLKKCIQFDPSIGNFWNYHFKYTFQNNEGNKQFCYLKDCYF